MEDLRVALKSSYPSCVRKTIDGFGCPGNARMPLEDRRRSRNSDGGSIRVLEEKGLLKWKRGVERSEERRRTRQRRRRLLVEVVMVVVVEVKEVEERLADRL